MGENCLRSFLFLGLSRPDLPIGLATRAVSAVRCEYRVGNDRRHRVHVGSWLGQSGRWLVVAVAEDPIVAAARSDRIPERIFWFIIAWLVRARSRMGRSL